MFHAPFHNTSNVDTTITALVALTDNADPEEVNSVHVERDSHDVE